MLSVNHLFNRNSILFVGSDQEHLRQLAVMVKKDGFDHFLAYDMTKARQTIVDESPDVIFIDWEHSQEIENLCGLCKQPYATIFVIAENDTDSEEVFKLLRLGVDDFLKKPIDQYELRAKVHLGIKLSKAFRLSLIHI